jgi:hypothetical protein
MSYTLGDAARATGKAKPTIAKAIATGRVSAERNEDGSYRIDPAELHRVYPMIGSVEGNGLQKDTPTAATGLRGEVDLWRALATEREATIRDLRARLDAADARIDRLMLSDRPFGAQPAGPRRRWWYRFRKAD